MKTAETMILREGIDLALVAKSTGGTLIFRKRLLSPAEARNFGETFRHILAAFNQNVAIKGYDTKFRWDYSK